MRISNNELLSLPGFIRSPNLIKQFMELALEQATAAFNIDEVPVGAVLVDENKLIVKNHNRIKASTDPTSHAEILCFRKAGKLKKTERPGGVLFVTLEPCVMCLGGAILARTDAVIFAAFDPKTGACGSAIDLFAQSNFNHKMPIISGFMQDSSAELLRKFFAGKRAQKKKRRIRTK